MQEALRSRRQWLFLPFLGVCGLLDLAGPARATEPVLTVISVDGDSTVYAVNQIQKLTFTGNTLNVAAYGGVDHYPAAEVAKILFRWLDPAGVKDPNDAAALVKAMHLFQNRPNPFAPETQIAFDLPKAGQVGLAIYSPDGRLVRQLLSEQRGVGRHSVSWDGRDDAGRTVASGTYFYQLRAPGVKESRRMILLP
jgi:hypothetical protein